jgi:hypothetical protein
MLLMMLLRITDMRKNRIVTDGSTVKKFFSLYSLGTWRGFPLLGALQDM